MSNPATEALSVIRAWHGLKYEDGGFLLADRLGSHIQAIVPLATAATNKRSFSTSKAMWSRRPLTSGREIVFRQA